MAQPETFADATPDMNTAADNATLATDQSVVASDSLLEAASPSYYNLVQQDQHYLDQEKVNVDDLVVQARQKQLDLVQGTYGESGPASDLTAANQALNAEKAQETSDKTLP